MIQFPKIEDSHQSRPQTLHIGLDGGKVLLDMKDDVVHSTEHLNIWKSGAPERIRTSDPLIRSQVLYPAELRVRSEAV